MTDERRPLVIAGAGCAGLSLAVALLDEGWDLPLVVVDRRTDHARDRTWCFWETGEIPWSHLADERWSHWTIGGVRQSADEHPYLHLASDRFARAALNRLRRARNVDLRLGTRVRALTPRAGEVVVDTSSGRIRATRAVDARGPGAPALRAARGGIVQRFLGRFVRTDVDRFDPGEVILMDFTPPAGRELRFVYVLPFSPREALVEDTSFGRDAVSARARRAAVDRWIGTSYELLAEEAGAIPMSAVSLPVRQAPGLFAAGLAAGAARPSSGYAFVRIQRQVAALAQALVEDREHVRGAQHPRVAALDALFLRALDADPAAFAGHFRSLAAGVPGDVLARFMNDASSVADEVRVVTAMPPGPFVPGLP